MDLTLIARLPATDQSLDDRTSEFVRILSDLTKTRLCGEGWFTSTPKFEGDTSGFDPITNPEGFAKDRVTEVDVPEEYHQTKEYFEDPGPILSEEDYPLTARHPSDYPSMYSAAFSGITAMDLFKMDFWKPHPQFGTDARLYIELVDTIIVWAAPDAPLCKSNPLFHGSPSTRPISTRHRLDGLDPLQSART